MTAEQIIRKLELIPMPDEGGYYRQTWRSEHGTAILFLLTPERRGFSALHVLDRPEVYHFYSGDPTRLALFPPDGPPTEIRLGSDLTAGETPQHTVPAGTVQGARLVPEGRWALLGTTMAPGYNPDGFKLSDRETLLAQYPDHAEWITALTRTDEEFLPVRGGRG